MFLNLILYLQSKSKKVHAKKVNAELGVSYVINTISL